MKSTHVDSASAQQETAMPPLQCAVPEDLLRLPFSKDRRWILRFPSGLLLDPHLRKLARISGAVDAWLAHGLARLRAAPSLVRLGRSTFDGYVAERLGLKPRTAREIARVGKVLERMPHLDRALRDGRVTWSAAAEVARLAPVIDGELDECAWVHEAAQQPFKQLKEAVAAARKERLARPTDTGSLPVDEVDDTIAAAGETPNPSSAADASEEDADEDPLVPMAVRASAGAAMLWGASLELGEIVAGRTLLPGEGEEYLLQEFLSGTTPAEGVFADARFPLPVLQPARRRSQAKSSTERRPASELGDRPLSVEISAEIANALLLVDRPVPDDLFEIDACARQLLRARAGLDLHLGRMLRIFQSLNLAGHLGFDGFAHYVQERLQISASRAKSLVTLDRLLTDQPEIESAVRKGHVGTVAALAIARIARRGRSARAWVRRARTRTLKRLREEIACAEKQADRDPRFDFMPPPTGPLPSDLAQVTARVSTEAGGRACAHLGHAPWVRLTGDPAIDDHPLQDDPQQDEPDPQVSDGLKSAERADVEMGAGGPGSAAGVDLSQGADGLKSAKGADGRAGAPWVTGMPGPAFVDRGSDLDLSDPDRGPFERVRFLLRRSMAGDWNEARRRIASSCGRWNVTDGRVLFEIAVAFLRTWLPQWIDAVLSEDPIAVRDRFRCQMPGCPHQRGAGHHLRLKSRGGPDEFWNLLFLCEQCHLEAVHRQRSIRIHGHAPNLLIAELGVRPDGRPLEVWLRRPFRQAGTGGDPFGSGIAGSSATRSPDSFAA